MTPRSMDFHHWAQSQSYWLHKLQSGNTAGNTTRETCNDKGYIHGVVFKEGTHNSICVSTHRVHHQVLTWLNSKHSCVHVLGAHHKHSVNTSWSTTVIVTKQNTLVGSGTWNALQIWINMYTATKWNRNNPYAFISLHGLTLTVTLSQSWTEIILYVFTSLQPTSQTHFKHNMNHQSHCHRVEQQTCVHVLKMCHKHPANTSHITIHTVKELNSKHIVDYQFTLSQSGTANASVLKSLEPTTNTLQAHRGLPFTLSQTSGNEIFV